MAYVTRSRRLGRLLSNNPDNPNKNMCALAVAKSLYVHDETLYLHTWDDLKRAINKLWHFRSIRAAIEVYHFSTVGSIRKSLREHSNTRKDCAGYVVKVSRHVILLDRNGSTLIDTAPVKRDCRVVEKVYAVYAPAADDSKFTRLKNKIMQRPAYMED